MAEEEAMSKSRHPTGRMGVYKQLDDVPSQHRLSRYEAMYDGRDAWTEFLTEQLFQMYDSARFKQEIERAGRHWKEHMETHDRHHALARPVDVELWCQDLLDRLNVRTAYNSYWVRIERFYSWLQWHRAHPHRYHPVLMAAADGSATGEIWAEKISRGRGGDGE